MENYVNGYAHALLSLAHEHKLGLAHFKNQCETIASTMTEVSDFLPFLLQSNLDFATKQKLVVEAFKMFDKNLNNLVLILLHKSKLLAFTKILSKTIALINDELAIKVGILYTTKPLSTKILNEFKTKIEIDFDVKKLELVPKIDYGLVFGFRFEMDDLVVEDSMHTRLAQIGKTVRNR